MRAARSKVGTRWLGAAVACFVAGAGLRAAPPVPVHVTGPADNRVNVFFLGDGYTASQIETTYAQHVQAMLHHLFNNGQDPYPRYKNFFNAYRVNVVSAESGADVPPDGIFRDTALDARYYFDGSTERLMYVSDSKADAALNASLAGTGLSADVRYLTVNDTKYGGGGGRYSVYAGGNVSATEIALHESAHSFNRLADEYGGFTTTYAGGEPSEVNVTKSATGAKWSHWIGYDQPGVGVIGAYEGGRYYDKGLYRPSQNSKMRSLGRPFDAVSREKIVLDIYRLIRPMDAYLSNAATVDNPRSFWVDVVDPSVVNVQWSVDGTTVPGATGERFNPLDFGFTPGTYNVTARAYDPTDWVRINRHLLEQSVTWSLTLFADGDANGDGLLTADDYALLDRGLAMGLSGWSNGDFDASGVVDVPDYLIIDRALALSHGGTLDPALLADRTARFGTTYATDLLASIPEPASLTWLLVPAVVLSRRRVASLS